MSRGWKSFVVLSRKILPCYKQTMKGDSGEGSEGKEESCKERASLSSENIQVNLNRVLVEPRAEKTILMRAQMEMEAYYLKLKER